MKEQATPSGAFLLRRAAVDLLFPRRCPFCGGVIGGLSLCPDCAATMERLERPVFRLEATEHEQGLLEGQASLYEYKGAVRRAIRTMKYAHRPWYGREFGYQLANRLYGCTFRVQHGIIGFEPPPFFIPGQEALVSVPSSHKNRGYDAVALMAQALAESLQLPYLPGALTRVRPTPPQASLGVQQRLENQNGAMAARPQSVEGKRILLVDDVITTGATVVEAGRALLKAGALEVFAVSAAAARLNGPTSAPDNIKDSI